MPRMSFPIFYVLTFRIDCFSCMRFSRYNTGCLSAISIQKISVCRSLTDDLSILKQQAVVSIIRIAPSYDSHNPPKIRISAPCASCPFSLHPQGHSGIRMQASMPSDFSDDYLKKDPGSHLLSHTVSSAVSSASWVLTIVFGMGTGVSPRRIATGRY